MLIIGIYLNDSIANIFFYKGIFYIFVKKF
nr:MAG TPA: hypothetical protein [Microviridae sp.]